MSAVKFKKVFSEMLEENKELFDRFKVIHDKFAADKSVRKEFNKQGEEVIAVMRRYESILCGRSEGSGYGNYSHKLADKFWSEIRKTFSEIDEIGVEVE